MKFVELLCILVFIGGFLMVALAVGGLEQDTLSVVETVKFSAIGFIISIIARKIWSKIEEKEDE